MSYDPSRLTLLAITEPGATLWSEEISTHGAVGVLERLHERIYDPIKHSALYQRLSEFDAEKSIQHINDVGAQMIVPGDSEWPVQLDDLIAPPIALLVKGFIDPLQKKSLAIVGTRNPTPYGTRIAGDFAAGFADREWPIISGGAYGIDSAAHRGALVAEGATVAVIASGIDVEYPLGNSRLFAEICENGAIVSEYLPGVPALPHRFLIRNRLIAALSKSTLVVEAAFRSGSLRTARDAAELMRPVMAIPGPINSPSSEGCHRLIGERCAELVTSVTDAFELISAL